MIEIPIELELSKDYNNIEIQTIIHNFNSI
jgi:hypothetical protein